jgi:hypothetical protein
MVRAFADAILAEPVREIAAVPPTARAAPLAAR